MKVNPMTMNSDNAKIIRSLIGICGALFLIMLAICAGVGFYVAGLPGLFFAMTFGGAAFVFLVKSVMRDEKVMTRPKKDNND